MVFTTKKKGEKRKKERASSRMLQFPVVLRNTANGLKFPCLER